MIQVDHFAEVLNFIVDEELRSFVAYFLEYDTPAYFWTDGASSSGKYHPQFAQGTGGLVRHTIAGAIFMEEVLRMSPYCYLTDEQKDYCRAAMILHDTRKYGAQEEPDKKAYKLHAANAATAVASEWGVYFDFDIPCPWQLTQAIKAHMGQWSEKEDRPMTNLDRAVHTADYWASRPMIDIPGIMEKWQEIEGVANAPMSPDETDLPFYFDEEKRAE